MAMKPSEFAELLREFIGTLSAFRYSASDSSYDLESRARELLDRAAELPVDVRTKTRTRTQLEELRRELDLSKLSLGSDPKSDERLISERLHWVRTYVVPKLYPLADELAVWLPVRPTESDGQSDNPVEPLAGVDVTWGGQGRPTAKQLLALARVDGWTLDVEPEVPCDPDELHEYMEADTPPKGVDTGDGRGEVDGNERKREVIEAEFLFRPDGDGYFLIGFGEQGHVTANGATGLHNLYRLVQSQGVPVPMLELVAGPGTKRKPGDKRSRQPVADGETFKQLAAKRKQLKADIESAGSDMERGELETELAELEETAKTMRGLNGKSRDLNNPNDGLRSTIHKRLNRVYKKLQGRMPELVKHFGLSCGVSGGDGFVYAPAALNITWDTEAE